MRFVLAWEKKMLSALQGMIWKEYYQARNAVYSTSHLQCDSIFPWQHPEDHLTQNYKSAAPGEEWSPNQALVAGGWARARSLTGRAEKPALNLATLLCCVTCSDRAWQILKRAWWHLESTVDSANMPSNQSVHDKLWNTYCENYGLCHHANLLLKTYRC